jgi:hypothetical protein
VFNLPRLPQERRDLSEVPKQQRLWHGLRDCVVRGRAGVFSGFIGVIGIIFGLAGDEEALVGGVSGVAMIFVLWVAKDWIFRDRNPP